MRPRSATGCWLGWMETSAMHSASVTVRMATAPVSVCGEGGCQPLHPDGNTGSLGSKHAHRSMAVKISTHGRIVSQTQRRTRCPPLPAPYPVSLPCPQPTADLPRIPRRPALHGRLAARTNTAAGRSDRSEDEGVGGGREGGGNYLRAHCERPDPSTFREK